MYYETVLFQPTHRRKVSPMSPVHIHADMCVVTWHP